MAKKKSKKSGLLNQRMTFSSLQVILFVLLFAAVGVIAILQSAAAPGGGKGGGKPISGSSSLSLVLVSPSADNLPHWGQQVKFSVSTTATTEPHVSLKCYQNGALVYTSQTGYYDGYPWPWTQTFTLSSGAWTSGAADCNALLYSLSNTKSGTTNLATLDFHVYE